MLRITVELLPGGLHTRARTLGVLTLTNTGESATPMRGHYVVRKFDRRGRFLRAASIRDWPRPSRPVWDLVAEALRGLNHEGRTRSKARTGGEVGPTPAA